MDRIESVTRPDWAERVTRCGVLYHSTFGEDGTLRPYWDESHYYRFAAHEARELYRVAEECQALLLESLAHELTRPDGLDRLHVPEYMRAGVLHSWEHGWPTAATRMDFAYDGTRPARLLEYNADTCLLGPESALAQWEWVESVRPQDDQANHLHETLVAFFQALAPSIPQPVWFLGPREDPEGEYLMNLTWMRDAAVQAGISTQQGYLEDLDDDEEGIIAPDGSLLAAAVKSYNWHTLDSEWSRVVFPEFLAGENVALWLNPPFTAALGSKALLATAWELYPDHPNLLASYMDTPRELTNWTQKPVHGYDGLGVALFRDGVCVEGTPSEGVPQLFQDLAPLPDLGGGQVVVSVWLVGTEACAIALRESSVGITSSDTIRFVPHIVA